MKKNFLLLLLMSLLPLAGWAEAVVLPTDLAVTFTAATYTGSTITPSIATATATVGGTANTDVSGKVVIDGVFSDQACTNPAGTVKNAGTYYVRIKGDGTNYKADSYKVLPYVVGKYAGGDIKVSAQALSKVYGAAYPTTGYYTATMPTGATETVAQAGLVVTPSFSDWDVKKKAGTHEFEIEVNTPTNYNVTVEVEKANLTINKVNLTVKAKDITKEYGQTPVYEVTYGSNLVAGDDAEFEGKVVYTVKNASDKTFEQAKGAKGTYTITPSGLSSDNYAFTYQTGTLTVNARNISHVAFVMAGTTYDSQDQLANLKKIKTMTDDGTIASPAEGPKAADFTVDIFADETGGSAITTATTQAGQYWALISASGASNYTGTATARVPVVLAKKQLNVITQDAEKDYDGATYTIPNGNYLVWSGLESSDQYSATVKIPAAAAYITGGYAANFSTSLSTPGATNAGEYTINVSSTKAADQIFKNYTVNYVNTGKLTINKVQVSMKPSDLTIQYGDQEPDWAKVTMSSFDISYKNKNAGTAVTLATLGDDIDDVFTTKPTINRVIPTGKTAGEVGTYDLIAQNYVLKAGGNYEFAADQPAKGTLTIQAATSITVEVKNLTAVFGEYANAAAVLASDKLDVRLSGVKAEDKDKVTVNLSVVDASSKAFAGKRGTYTIKIGDVTLADDIKANYEGVSITKLDGTFTVGKAPLKIEALAQSLAVGEAILPASAETVKINTEGVSDDDIAALFNATNGIKLEWGTHLISGTHYNAGTKVLEAAAATAGWNGTATTTDGIFVDGIAINATAYNAADVNYILTGTGAEAKVGKLTVTAAGAAAILDNTATATTQITNQVDKKQAITISTTANKRKLYANQWNALVLPFDITPYEFTQAIGTYAVFDLLEAGGDALNFKISIGTIPAYTPFLVKVDKEIDLSTKQFAGVTVKAIDEAALTQSLSAEANYKFVGTVKKDNYGAPSWTIQPNSTDGSIKLVARKTAWEYKAFTAYLTTIDGTNPVTAPVIYVEEPDGVVTAIKSINADGVAVPADGWYTLGGVKLQGQPTEKGVYIKDGKKFVIK